MFTSELEYYRQRAREERERAATAPGPIVAQVHLALAERYDGLSRHPEIRVELSRLWRSREPPVQGASRRVEEAPGHNATPKAPPSHLK